MRGFRSVLLFFSLFIVFSLGILTLGIIREPKTGPEPLSRQAETLPEFRRDNSSIDFSGFTFTPWDVKAASAKVKPEGQKAYTILVYMNGSDLESENGAATDDIEEMLEANIDPSLINLIILTGGTNYWQNELISPKECALWQIKGDEIEKISGIGLKNMGDPGTLASFIQFGLANFPAEKYGLIFWDHGGGSIAGYGHDEKFNNARLSLLEMEYAFQQGGLDRNKLEFLGYDACLMATVEMALVAAPYARYLIASEDLEPGEGWDYYFLSELNNDPGQGGVSLGKQIVDYFVAYYREAGLYNEENLTLSVTDLSRVGPVMGAMGQLMSRGSAHLLENQGLSFKTLSQKRNRTKTFGEGSPRDNDCDMVDLADMANKLKDLYQKEANDLLSALAKAVLYTRDNSEINLGGLSTFYLFGGKDDAENTLPVYESLSMSPEYTDYLYSFASHLLGSPPGDPAPPQGGSGKTRALQLLRDDKESLLNVGLAAFRPLPGEDNRYYLAALQYLEDEEDPESIAWGESWPFLADQPVCLHQINSSQGGDTYVIPAGHNGEDVDIVVYFPTGSAQGSVLGVRREDGYLIQKGLEKIKKGDKISFSYETAYFSEDKTKAMEEWYHSPEITVDEEALKLEKRMLSEDEGWLFSYILTDIQLEQYYLPLR